MHVTLYGEIWHKILFAIPFHKRVLCEKLRKCSYVLLYSAASMRTVGSVITVIMNRI